MRQLITDDVFKMSVILNKIDSDQIVEAINECDADDEEKAAKTGAKLIVVVFKNLHLVKNEINDFFGGLAEMSGEEFGKLPIQKSKAIIEEFAKSDDLASFFKLAGR